MGDTDAYGHVNNASYASYAEIGRIDFWREAGGIIGAFILAHLAIDFRRQVTYGESVHVETWIETIGRTSGTLRQQIMVGSAVAADVRSVIVHFDYKARMAVPIPDPLRVRLSRYS
jgi:acyl-CoA thioester hydrolase